MAARGGCGRSGLSALAIAPTCTPVFCCNACSDKTFIVVLLLKALLFIW